MPKRKSSKVDELKRLKKRLKTLEEKMEKPRGRHRIRVIEEPSSSSVEISRNRSPSPKNPQDGDMFGFEEPHPRPLTDTQDNMFAPDNMDFQTLEDNLPPEIDKNVVKTVETNQDSTASSDIAMNNIILDILGGDPTSTTDYGKEIHAQLASRLEHFAINGLTKDARKELSDKYLVPLNCARIGAPLLNAEIKAALPANLLKRDKAIEARQKLIAKAISSLASAVTVQLNSDYKNQELLKNLMDTGRLLCDIQHAESLTRRNFVLFSVNKDLKEQLSNIKIDKYLFGENLSETLKTAKAISKTGTDLKQCNAYTKKSAPLAQKLPGKNLNYKPPAPVRRQQGPQRSREPAPSRQPSSLSRPSQRQYRTTRRQ